MFHRLQFQFFNVCVSFIKATVYFVGELSIAFEVLPAHYLHSLYILVVNVAGHLLQTSLPLTQLNLNWGQLLLLGVPKPVKPQP